MGLRDDLADILAIQELSGGFLGATGKLREQAAQANLTQQLPELIDTQNYGQAAALANAAGDPKLYQAIIEKQLSSKSKAQTASINRDQVKVALKDTIYANDDATIDNIASIEDPALRSKLLLDYRVGGRQTERATTQKEQFGAKYGRDLQKDAQTQREKFTAGFDKLDSDYKEFDQKVEFAKKALADSSRTGVAITMGTVARVLADEKGPLANEDFKRIVFQGFGSTIDDLVKQFTGDDKTPVQGKQLETFNRLLNMAQQNREKYFQQDVYERINRAKADYPLLYKDGSPDAAIKARINQLKEKGFEISEDGGSVKSPVKKTSIKQPSSASVEGQGVDVSGLATKIAQIKDPDIKKAASEQLAQFHNKKMSKENYDKFLQRIQPYLGQ